MKKTIAILVYLVIIGWVLCQLGLEDLIIFPIALFLALGQSFLYVLFYGLIIGGGCCIYLSCKN
jgi:hypothetical protein